MSTKIAGAKKKDAPMRGNSQVTASSRGRGPGHPFVKGKSGNPAGRPRGRKSITSKEPDKQAINRHRTVTSWQPGQSGNPFGRPRAGSSLAEAWRDYMNGPSGPKDMWSRKTRLAQRLYNLALKGSVPAARLLVDQVSRVELEERLSALEQRVSELASPRIGLHEYRR